MTNTFIAVPSGQACSRMPKMARREFLERVFSVTPGWVTISYGSVAQDMLVAYRVPIRYASRIKRPIIFLVVTISYSSATSFHKIGYPRLPQVEAP